MTADHLEIALTPRGRWVVREVDGDVNTKTWQRLEGVDLNATEAAALAMVRGITGNHSARVVPWSP